MADQRDVFSEMEQRGEPETPTGTGSPAGADKKDDDTEMVPRARLNEALDRSKLLEESQDQFVLAALKGGQQAPAAPTETPEQSAPFDLSVLEGLDPEVAGGIMQAIQSGQQEFAKNFMAQFQQTYGPALESATEQQHIREVETTVEGFKEVEGKVGEAFRALPPEKRREYDSRLGVQALTSEVRLQEALELVAQLQGGVSPQAGRAAMTPVNRGSFDGSAAQADQEVDIWGLSDEDFETYQRQHGLV